MGRHRRAVGGLFGGVVVIALLAGCAAPGDIQVVRNPGEFTFGTDGDGLPDTYLTPQAPTSSPDGMVIAIDGQLWRVEEVLLLDPVLHSTLVTATLKNMTTGEVVTRTFDAATLSPIVDR